MRAIFYSKLNLVSILVFIILSFFFYIEYRKIFHLKIIGLLYTFSICLSNSLIYGAHYSFSLNILLNIIFNNRNSWESIVSHSHLHWILSFTPLLIWGMKNISIFILLITKEVELFHVYSSFFYYFFPYLFYQSTFIEL